MPITTYVGDLGTPFTFTLTLVDGVTHPNLTGLNVTSDFRLHLYNTQTNAVKICTGPGQVAPVGVWTIINGAGGQCQYQPVAKDVDTAGMWQVYLSIQIASQTGYWKTFQPDTITVQLLE